MARFQRGNPGGPGGKRDGAGRKPSEVKQASRLFWAGKREAAEKVLDAALQLPDYDELARKLAACEPEHREAVIEAWKAQHDVPWRERLKAAELVMAYCDGRPVQKIDAKVSSENAMSMVERAEKAEVAEAAALGAAFQTQKRSR